MTQKTLLSLIRKTLTGNREAFERLLLSQKTLIHRTIRRMIECPEDVEDISQEVAILIFKHIKSLRNPESFGSWVRTLATHECRRHIAARKPCLSLENHTGWENLNIETDTDCIPVDRMERLESNASLRIALAKMPKTIQRIIFLRYYNGMRCSEIASYMRMKAGTVSVALFRAKKQLRKKLRR